MMERMNSLPRRVAVPKRVCEKLEHPSEAAAPAIRRGRSSAGKLLPLPDYLRPGLELVFVGFNPGERSARLGHYYAGIGNLFWRGLSESGLVPETLTFSDDARIMNFGIGLTDLARQPSKSITDLPKAQFMRGRAALRRKLRVVSPSVIAFIGKGVFEIFLDLKTPCALGAQVERICGAAVFVLPSTSARNASVRREEKIEWFHQLNSFIEEQRIRKPHIQACSSRGMRRRTTGRLNLS
jgi:TDG/mug DNA glycosylase family protein